VLCPGGYIFNTEAHPVDAASLYCCSSEKTRDDAAVNAMMTNVDLISTLNLFADHSIYQRHTLTPTGLLLPLLLVLFEK